MIDQIVARVQEELKDDPKRFKHVLGVVDTAIALANIHGSDPYKAKLAALYHDCLRIAPVARQIQYLDLKTIKKYSDYPAVYHAYAAAASLQNDFGIKDSDILNAIRYHVWGRPKMSTLEKIIFISDACEPNRTFSDRESLYELSTKDLNQAVCNAMKKGIDYQVEKGNTPNPDQLEAYQYYLEVTSG